jgi:hypothetical protein
MSNAGVTGWDQVSRVQVASGLGVGAWVLVGSADDGAEADGLALAEPIAVAEVVDVADAVAEAVLPGGPANGGGGVSRISSSAAAAIRVLQRLRCWENC